MSSRPSSPPNTKAKTRIKVIISALGQKQTFAAQEGMSALAPKADMCGATKDVRFGPKADIRLIDKPPGTHLRWPAFRKTLRKGSRARSNRILCGTVPKNLPSTGGSWPSTPKIKALEAIKRPPNWGGLSHPLIFSSTVTGLQPRSHTCGTSHEVQRPSARLGILHCCTKSSIDPCCPSLK